ncbi:unnamed protein product [Absidia cylindrospora]
MFGGDAFRSMIGDLAMGEMFSENMEESLSGQDGTEAGSDVHKKQQQQMTKEQMDKLKAQQQERIKKLSENLIHKLSLYTDSAGDEAAALAFQEQIIVEAEKLKEESYGLELLHAIGYVYSSKGRHHLGLKGGELPSIFQSIKQKKHIVKELWTTIRSAMDIQNAAEMVEKAEKEGMDQAEKLKLEEEVSNKVYKALWQTSKFEVEGTLRQVCDSVLQDKTVSSKIRYKRAEALRLVGHIYKRVEADAPVSDTLIKKKN